MPENSGEDSDDHDTQCGDLAKQMNDTSFFANPDLQLPDDLNFFSKDKGEIIFHPKDENANIMPIDDNMADLA